MTVGGVSCAPYGRLAELLDGLVFDVPTEVRESFMPFLEASSAWLRADKFQVAGIPGLHWRTAEACLRPEASDSRVWARFTDGSDLGSGEIDGLSGKRQAGRLFEPDCRAQLGCSFREALL